MILIKYTVSVNNYINLNNAIQKLKNNEVVVLPTECVYGLFSLKQANINKIKQRNNKYICTYILKNDDIINQFGSYSTLLPGPITIVYNNIGYRCSSNSYIQYILSKINQPLYGTSANLTGDYPITCAEHCKIKGNIFNGGRCTIGLESTVISLNDMTIIREGPVQLNELKLLKQKPKYKLKDNCIISYQDIKYYDFWYLTNRTNQLILPNNMTYYDQLIRNYFIDNYIVYLRIIE